MCNSEAMRAYEGRKLRTSSRKRATSLPEDSPKSKEAILAAALRVFASDGYDGASMPRIAKVAQVAAPLIHYYFGSKENLWRETVAWSLADLRRDALAIGNATRALAPLDRLRVFLQTVTRHAARWPDNFVMIIAEARSESDRFAWVQENYTGVIFEELRSILQDAKDRKVIKNIAIDQLASLLVGGVLVYFTANPEVSNNTDPKDLDRISGEYTDLMFELLLDGISRKKR
jgi:TetR/AcrR family transcriptional regulator